jgi:peptidylprolyl isomerase
VATSRRRERELARRRFERRRQAEQERRARTKRRNTVVGASVGTVVVIGAVVALVIGLTGGNSKSSLKAGAKPTASASPSASSTPAPPAPKKCAKISPNPPAKGDPVVPQVKGKLSSKLVTNDVKVGHGPAAKSGDAVQVKYVGISCDSGKVFDASYTDPPSSTTHKRLLPFTLGQHQVISGWDQGIVGMKAGGVRELVIPASLAYGPTGQPPAIQGNDTLLFLVTMVKV